MRHWCLRSFPKVGSVWVGSPQNGKRKSIRFCRSAPAAPSRGFFCVFFSAGHLRATFSVQNHCFYLARPFASRATFLGWTCIFSFFRGRWLAIFVWHDDCNWSNTWALLIVPSPPLSGSRPLLPSAGLLVGGQLACCQVTPGKLGCCPPRGQRGLEPRETRVQKTRRNPEGKFKGTKSANKGATGLHRGQQIEKWCVRSWKLKIGDKLGNERICTGIIAETSWNDGWSLDEWSDGWVLMNGSDDWSSVGLHESCEQTCETSESSFSLGMVDASATRNSNRFEWVELIWTQVLQWTRSHWTLVQMEERMEHFFGLPSVTILAQEPFLVRTCTVFSRSRPLPPFRMWVLPTALSLISKEQDTVPIRWRRKPTTCSHKLRSCRFLCRVYPDSKIASRRIPSVLACFEHHEY